MTSLYPKHCVLPSLALTLALGGCDNATPPDQQAEIVPNAYRETLREAEAAKQATDQRQSEQRRIDAVLDEAGSVRR